VRQGARIVKVYQTDTIVACATAVGHAAIAVVRLSGPRAFQIADELFVSRSATGWRPWKLRRGRIQDPATSEAIDDALAVRMPGPATYTGEDVVELHCHGSPLIVERTVECALRAGARTAAPGEFTRRAVLNGRMDLAQAEAVADLIGARFRSAARVAWEQLQGALSDALAAVRADLVELLASSEASIDFVEDEIPDADSETLRHSLERVQGQIDRLLSGSAVARRLRDGYSVVFAGRPNVGKSSLINALLGHGRMIVSAEPGTTRDAVEEVIELDGLAFVLTDTAGVGHARGVAETAAIELAERKRAQADLVVVVLDGSHPLVAEERELLRELGERQGMVIVNKADLPAVLDPGAVRALTGESCPILSASALMRAGCEAICTALVGLARGDRQETESALVSRARHRAALERAKAALEEVRAKVRTDAGDEIIALELRTALSELASITDPVNNDQILDRIFATFCIGK
jgi:tRNA modification GTPase